MLHTHEAGWMLAHTFHAQQERAFAGMTPPQKHNTNATVEANKRRSADNVVYDLAEGLEVDVRGRVDGGWLKSTAAYLTISSFTDSH